MTHPNETMLTGAYHAFAAGDLAVVTDMFSDDITWHASGMSPVSGDYRGKDQIMEFFAKMFQAYDGTLQVEVLDILANDDHGVVLTKERGTSAGENVEFRSVHLWSIREGRCTSFASYEDDAYHRFWSPSAVAARTASQR